MNDLISKIVFNVKKITDVKNAFPGVYKIQWNYTYSSTIGIIYRHKHGKKMLITPNRFSVETLKSNIPKIQYLELIEDLPQIPWNQPIHKVSPDIKEPHITAKSVKIEEDSVKSDKFLVALNKFEEAKDLINDDSLEVYMDKEDVTLSVDSSDLEITIKKKFNT